jgi:hypothetical protein
VERLESETDGGRRWNWRGRRRCSAREEGRQRLPGVRDDDGRFWWQQTIPRGHDADGVGTGDTGGIEREAEGEGRTGGGGGQSVAAGRGSRGSMAMTMPLPNARLCSIYGLKASEAVTSILEMES